MTDKTKKIFLTVGGLGLVYWTFSSHRKGSFDKMEIVLYDLDYCPYCKKVRDKLDDLGLDYTKKSVEISKNKKELAEKRDGKTTVPYIEIAGYGFEESDTIVDILEQKFGC